MEMNKKFKQGDLVVIDSKTSKNNKSICEVLGYTKGKENDILRIKCEASIFNIRESSIRMASNLDIIRNLSDEELKKLIPRDKRKKAVKKYRKEKENE